ncbi:MAG: hypothetical protein ACO1N7_01990 [Sphingobacteriaceae bacterium]
MKFPVIYIPFLPMAGMAVFPFILIKKLSFMKHKTLINHEKIHLAQQLELLFIGFYLLYLVNYLYNLVKYLNHHKAYFNIVFEKEAYAMESSITYLKKRTLWQWTQYL